MSESTVVHYLVLAEGAILDVESCEEAFREGPQYGEYGDDWQLEWHHYSADGEPLAGGEWPCGCDYTKGWPEDV